LRKRLVESGVPGELIYVATQADNLTPSEVQQNLQLDASTPRLQCAEARNEYIQGRLHTDFYESIDVADHPVNTGSGFEFPVFTAAAIEYQKMTGVLPDGGGGPTTFASVGETQLPQLHTCLRLAATQLATCPKNRTKIGERLRALRTAGASSRASTVAAAKNAEIAARSKKSTGGGGGAGGSNSGRGGGTSATLAAAAAAATADAAATTSPDTDSDDDCIITGETNKVLAYIELSDSD
jgi:hypothetical protein